MTEAQKDLLLFVAAETGVSAADLSSGEMRIAEMLVDENLCFFDLTLRLTKAGWAALERAET